MVDSVRFENMIGIQVPWLVTSATLPDKQRDAVLESLGIKHALELRTSLDCTNLYYNIIQIISGINYKEKTHAGWQSAAPSWGKSWNPSVLREASGIFGEVAQGRST